MKFIITLVLLLLPNSTPDYKVDVKVEEHVVHYSMTINPGEEIVMNGASSYASLPKGTELVEDTLLVTFKDGTEMTPTEFAEAYPASHLKVDKGRVSFYAYFHVFEPITASFDLKVTDFEQETVEIEGRVRYNSNVPGREDLNLVPYDTLIKLDKKEVIEMTPLEPATPIEKPTPGEDGSLTEPELPVVPTEPQEPAGEPKEEDSVNTPVGPKEPVDKPILVPNDELKYGVGSVLKPKPKQGPLVLGVSKEREQEVLPPTGKTDPVPSAVIALVLGGICLRYGKVVNEEETK